MCTWVHVCARVGQLGLGGKWGAPGPVHSKRVLSSELPAKEQMYLGAHVPGKYSFK